MSSDTLQFSSGSGGSSSYSISNGSTVDNIVCANEVHLHVVCI